MSTRSKLFTFIFKIVLGVALLVYLVLEVEPAEILATAARAELGWIFAALLLLPINVALDATAWWLVIKRVAPRTRWRQSIGATLSGYTLGFLTPGQFGEYPGRAFYVPHADKWEISVTVLTARLADMTVGIGAGLLPLVFFINETQTATPNLWWWLFAYGAWVTFLLVCVCLVPGLVHRVVHRFAQSHKIRSRIRFLKRLSLRRRMMVLGVAAVRYAVYSTQFFLLLKAFAPETSWTIGMTGIALVFMGNFIIPPVTIMDLGIREGLAVFFLGVLGVAAAPAFDASVFLFLVNLLLPALVGIPFAFRLRFDRRKQAQPLDAPLRAQPVAPEPTPAAIVPEPVEP